MLARLIFTFWQVCWLKLSPANTPNSPFLTPILVLGFVGIQMAQIFLIPVIDDNQMKQLMIQVVVTTLTLFGYTYFVLSLTQKIDRFIRAVNALFACSIIIQTVTLPVVLLVPEPVKAASQEAVKSVTVAQLTVFFMLFLLALWQIVVNIYIYQQSLSISQGKAFLAWFGLIATQMLLYYFGSALL